MPIEKVKSFLGEPSPGKDIASLLSPLQIPRTVKQIFLYLRLNKQNCVFRLGVISIPVMELAILLKWASQWESRNHDVNARKKMGTPRQLVPKYPEAILTSKFVF